MNSSNETLSIKPISSFSEALVKTGIYASLSIIMLVPYCMVLYIFKKHAKLYEGVAYKIIFCMGIVDCFQLLCHASTFIFTVVQISHKFILNKFFGAFIQGTTYTAWYYCLMLAINRFVIICLPRHIVKKLENSSFKYSIPIGWLWCLIVTCFHLNPNLAFIFYCEYSTWGAGENADWWFSFMVYVEFYICVLNYSACFGLYVITMMFLLVQKKKFLANKNHMDELKLLIQAFIITTFCVVVNGYWNFFYAYIEDIKLSTFIGMNLWILVAGYNWIMYLVFSRMIRGSFVEIFLTTKTKEKTITAVPILQESKN